MNGDPDDVQRTHLAKRKSDPRDGIAGLHHPHHGADEVEYQRHHEQRSAPQEDVVVESRIEPQRDVPGLAVSIDAK